MEQMESTKVSEDLQLEEQVNEPISSFEWIKTLLLMLVPVLNIVLIFVWAFSVNANPNKSNWARATLIRWIIIAFLVVIGFMISSGLGIVY